MKKKLNKGNKLIKRSGLRRILKEAGIVSVNENALGLLENFGEEIFEKVAEALKEKLAIGAKKVVKKEDVEIVLKEL